MSLSVFYYCICACLRRCRSFNPSLCRFLPFHLSYVAVSRQCRLSEFTLTGPLYCSVLNTFLHNSKSFNRVAKCTQHVELNRGGAPLYKLYRFVRHQRVWFLSLFGLK